jgi:hypothetical protein
MAKSKESDIKLSDLIPDDKNFNKGSEYGNGLIEKSFSKFGAGRSILIDKNNRIIAGNKSVENAMSIGLDDVQIVESDGKRIIAVKRMDIDLDTPQGREMALADNASAKANIVFDAELIEAELGEATAVEWGVPQSTKDIDYSILDDDDVSNQLKEMTDGVKKAIQIEFEAEHYEEAYALVKFWREQKLYIGGFLIEKLKDEKSKL